MAEWSMNPPSGYGDSIILDIMPYSPPAFKLIFCLAYSLTLETKVTCSSKISVDFQWTIWCYIQEDRTLFVIISEFPYQSISHVTNKAELNWWRLCRAEVNIWAYGLIPASSKKTYLLGWNFSDFAARMMAVFIKVQTYATFHKSCFLLRYATYKVHSFLTYTSY
jgi:hypothetical protein